MNKPHAFPLYLTRCRPVSRLVLSSMGILPWMGRYALGALLLSFMLCPLEATDYVSITFPKNFVLDSQDQPVTTNRMVWIGTFTNTNTGITNPSIVMDLARSNTNGAGVFASWTSNFAGLAQTNFSGRGLILTNRPTAAMTNKPIYVWMFNHTNPSQATEMILWRSQNPAYFDRSLSLSAPVQVSLDPSSPTASGAAFYGSAPLFGQYLPQAGCWRMSPIRTNADNRTTIEQISLSAVDWFVGDTNAALDLPANNGPTSFSVVVTNTNTGITSPLSSTGSIIGLSYSNGRISGLLTVTNTNQHVLWVTATNSNNLTAGAAGTLTLRVRPQTGPAFTNPAIMTATAGSDFAGFQLKTEASTNLPLTFTCLNAYDLAGFLLSSTGKISGTTFNTNTRTLRLQVKDSAGQVRRGILSFAGSQPSILISATNSDGILEVSYGMQTNFPVNYSTGFDNGSLEPELSGDDVDGVNTATFSAGYFTLLSNRPATKRGEATPLIELFANRVVDTIPPVIVTASVQIPVRVKAPKPTLSLPSPVRLFVGQSTNIDVAEGSLFTGGSTSYQVSNLPTGMDFNQGNKTISGTNSSTNQFRFRTTVIADNRTEYYGGGISEPAEIDFEISNRRPEFSSNNLIFSAGLNRYFISTFRINNLPTTATITGLPPGIINQGVSFDTNKATAILTIAGTATQIGPPSTVHIEVSNQEEPGNPSSQTLSAQTDITIHVADQRPTVAPVSLGNIPRNSTITLSDNLYLISGGADASGVRVSAYGLPPGILLDATTGKLYGTTSGAGTYTATVFIQNGKGWTKKTVSLTVQ